MTVDFSDVVILDEKVLVEHLTTLATLKNGLIMPDIAIKKNNHAKVLAVGPGKTLKDGTVVPLEVKVGDIVLIPLDKGYDFKFQSTTYISIDEKDILAIEQ